MKKILLTILCLIFTTSVSASTEFEVIVDVDSGAGYDYSSFSNWETACQTDLTATTTKVFGHSGITGAVGDGSTVTGQTSSATGRIVHATSDQILLDTITGTFSSGEIMQVSVGNSVTITDVGAGSWMLVTFKNSSGSTAGAGTMDGYTCDTDNYVKLWCDPDDIYRHEGVDENGKFTFTDNLVISDQHIIVDGFIMDGRKIVSNSDNRSGTTGSGGIIENCIVSGIWAPGGDLAIQNYGFHQGMIIRNNIVYDCGVPLGSVFSGRNFTAIGTTRNTFIHNNTIYGIYNNDLNGGDAIGISNTSSGEVYNNVVMNLFSENDLETYYVFGGTTHDYNASGDSSATGTNSLINVADTQFTETSSGIEDFHLATGSDLIGTGTDLSSDFTNDIDNDTRSDPWDIGADEYIQTLFPTVTLGAYQG